MVKQELAAYIEEARRSGLSDDVIASNLKGVGWLGDDIAEAMRDQKLRIPTPIRTSTPTPQSNTASIANSSETVHKVDPMNTIKVFLSAILCVSLLILVNKIFSDIKGDGIETTRIFILEGLLVIPLLVTAFILQNSFGRKEKGYSLISTPYFIVASYVFLRLLGSIVKNIWSTNATVGVYVTLGMVIVLLSGVVYFYQRLKKN